MLKSRKKMLLSSIAMLLVALVALGSATFAWYITNATVTAQTTTWNASSADGLVIRHGISGAWTNELTDLHTASSSMTPASITYGAFGEDTLYGATGTGKKFDDGALNNDGLSAQAVPQNSDGSPATSNQYFLVDTFYVASSTSASKTASFTVSGAPVTGTYLNIAIYVDGTLKKVLTSDSTASTTSKVGGTKTAPVTADGSQGLTTMSASGVDIGNITATAKADGKSGAKIDIVAFVDGYNENCRNSTANTTGVSLTYSFTVV
ncbi:MAG: hypothetical protein UH734_04070 [Ruminococcus sp.]|nr:hypothetical protein [Ruminococcus sp.]